MATTLKPNETTTNVLSPWHLSGSQLVAIDTETTGLDPQIHEIFQIAIIPLNYNFLPRDDVKPFNLSMKPENPQTIDYSTLSEMGVNRDKMELHLLHGVDQQTGVDLFCAWLEKLKLPPLRRLCVIAQNWPFDRQFIKNWLGNTLFDTVFHPHYRDLIPAFQLINDLYYFKGSNDVLYRQVNLSALCRMFNIERAVKHDALNDAAATAEIYRRLLSKYASGFAI